MYDSLLLGVNMDEYLVEIKENDGFVIDMQYPKLNMKYAINKCLVRKEVLNRLKIAKNYLPYGYNFKILDAYRPIELQKELYEKYYDKIIKEFNLDINNNIDNFINQFVSIPNEDDLYSPAHSTGGAIDITLIYNNKDIDMGAEFDEFNKKTFTNYYDDKDETISNNRRILVNAMEKAGFTNLESEFWHFDYGNINWSIRTNKKAIYKRI